MSVSRASIAAAVGAVVVMLVAGGLATEIGPWYRALSKPPWQPPDWLFGPVWTTIYALTAWAVVLAWNAAGAERGDRALIVGALSVNAVLNVFWSVLFFTARRPDWALWEVPVLWLSVAALMLVLGRTSTMAALLIAPYLAWVAFASVLNRAIVVRNAPFEAR